MVGSGLLSWSARRSVLATLASGLLVVPSMPAPAATARWLGVAIGVERYGGAPAVTGAIDGATALADALSRRGAAHVLLEDDRATRAAVLMALDRVVTEAGPGDIVVVGFDGRGRTRPASPDGFGWTLLLGGGQMLAGDEVAAFVRRVEQKGARALVVLDAEFGGAVPRARSGAAGERAAAADGGLGPASGAPPFARSMVLAASDVAFDSPPAWWPGRAGRGRLLARAVAHAIDAGEEPGTPLLGYAARVVYQLSAQRQQVAALGDEAEAGVRAGAMTRGIVIKATARLGAVAAEPALPAAPATAEPATLFPSALAQQLAEPIRIAPSTGGPERLSALLPAGVPARMVARGEDPDLIWDPAYKNVLTPEGDLVADDIDKQAIPRIVDRTLAVRQLKAMVVDAPQQVLLLPDDDVKPRGSVVTIEVGGAAGRSLILFNIRCDGKVQLLYPRANDAPMLTDDRYQLSLRVSDPVGADAIVAVTGTRRMAELEQGLAAINGQKAPLAAVKLVRDLALPGTQVGTVSIFSGVP